MNPLPADPYRVLGLSRDATRAQVDRAYRVLVRRLHPDTNRDPACAAQLTRVIDARQRLADIPDRPDPAAPATVQPAPVVGTPVRYPHRPHGATLVAGPVHIRPLPR